MQLSQHFIDNWYRRVGSWPTPELILDVVRRSVRVQPTKNLRDHDGSHFRMLSIYWHPDLDVVLKIDEYRDVAVTVLSRENFNSGTRVHRGPGGTENHPPCRYNERRSV